MRFDVLDSIKGNYATPVPPEGAVPTGELDPFNRQVYRMKQAVEIKTPLLEEPLQDGETLGEHIGEGLWTTSAGRTVQQRRKRNRLTGEFDGALIFEPTRVEYKDVEFVIDQSPQGHNSLNYHFRESPEELERQAFQKRRARALDQLADAIAEQEIDVDELVALAARNGHAEGRTARVPVTDDGSAGPHAEPWPLKMVRPGHWEMPDGELFPGNRTDAEEACRTIYGREPVAAE